MSKILYAAGTYAHITSFHIPYIEALRRDGHDVRVMAYGDGADFNVPFEKKMFSARNISCQKEIKRILKEEAFDAVILNTTLAAFNIRMALPRKGRPRVINFVHGYMFPRKCRSIKSKLFLAAERYLASRTDSILVMNDEDLEITREHKLCLGDVRMTRGMGARVPESSATREEIFKLMRCPEESYVISFVGELSSAKNQCMLISALPEIKTTIPNAVLWLVGEGEAHASLSEMAEKLSLSDSVYFTGRRTNPCDFVRASDLYVSPSRKEGLPFNVIEALGCGKTVLVSNVKGNRDLIEDSVSGYVFECDDVGGLVELVRRVHSGELSPDPEAVRSQYLKYSFENVFSETYEIIKELLER